MIEPLSVTLDLDCTAAHAFDTWVRRFGSWWPPGHSVSGIPDEIVLEPKAGGRIYERDPAGNEIDWGEVTLFEPPVRLAYLWHIRRDRADATDVEITFHEAGDGRCRVEIRHSGWERLGAVGQEWRDANRGGWAGLLPHFVGACSDGKPGLTA